MDRINHISSINYYNFKNEIVIVILGCGESGFGAALLAKQQSIPVFISDNGAIHEDIKNQLVDLEIDFEENGHELVYDITPTYVIKSPGIPNKARVIVFFKEKNIPVISEIEFGFQFSKGAIIGITGSNGKTTTTNLVYHLLNEAGYKVVKSGNVGYSFCKAVSERKYDYYVLELSSFQLDDIIHFKPHISTILNITPDHLDRYEYKFENYINSKFRILANQDKEDYFYFLSEDELIKDRVENLKPIVNQVPLKLQYNDQEILTINESNFNLSYTCLKGRHNAKNATIALKIAMDLGISDVKLQSALESFVNDPHRLENVASYENVEFINDSKATNVDSTFWALDAMKKKVVWIVGGQDKGNDYKILLPLVKDKVKAIVALGVDNSKIVEFFSPYVPIIKETNTMKDAVCNSFQLAETGEVVLLSPACASFDLFKNYMDRGDQFRTRVQELKIKSWKQ